MLIRRENESDADAVGAVTGAAFGTDLRAGLPPEVTLVSRLRRDDGYLPALALVAVDRDEVVGHVMCTRGDVDGRPAAGLGPLSVRPDHQRRGVGTALMHAVLGAADASGEPLVGVLGDPLFYGRFGFVIATELGVLAPDPAWGAHFQARPLHSWTPELVGTFRYAKPFADL